MTVAFVSKYTPRELRGYQLEAVAAVHEAWGGVRPEHLHPVRTADPTDEGSDDADE